MVNLIIFLEMFVWMMCSWRMLFGFVLVGMGVVVVMVGFVIWMVVWLFCSLIMVVLRFCLIRGVRSVVLI